MVAFFAGRPLAALRDRYAPGDEIEIAIGVDRALVHYAPDAESDYTPAGKHFDQFCTTCSQVFQISCFCDSKMAPDKTRQESCRFMQPQESMIAIDASNSKQGVACKERAESMLPPQKSRELARRLVASETGASTTSLQTEPATVRVYERLRRQFRAPVELTAFKRSLLVLWLWPSRNLRNSARCRLRRTGIARPWRS